MDYKSLKDFLATIKRINLRGDNKIVLPMKDAIDIQNDIALLLLELKDKDSVTTKVFDGGTFDK
tara:strand:- start:1785 stop:1976 length:192 start_codon:yes stop_codon:yes gene_type:complete